MYELTLTMSVAFAIAACVVLQSATPWLAAPCALGAIVFFFVGSDEGDD